MTANTQSNARHRIPWRILGWSIPPLLLLIPLVGGAPWTVSDFIVMGGLLGGVGVLIELAARASNDLAFRAGAALAVVTGFLLIWVNLAVGFLGDEGNPANLMFFGVLTTAIGGAVLGGFKAPGMLRAMLAAAAAQILVGVIGLAAGWASPENEGFYEVVMGTSLFTGLWLLAAALFRLAAGRQASTASAS